VLRRARSRADASECEGAAALRELREDEGAERFLRRGGPAFDGAGHGDLRRHDAGGLGMLEADGPQQSLTSGPLAFEGLVQQRCEFRLRVAAGVRNVGGIAEVAVGINQPPARPVLRVAGTRIR
jgi:hypothetical protein